MFLRLTKHHSNLLKQWCKKEHPNEACALLFGELTQKGAFVKKVVFSPNKLQSTTKFEMPAKVVIEAINEAEKENLDFIGIFHSHPASAVPSSTDLSFMKLWGEVIWLILSSTENNFAAHQIIDKKLIEVKVKIE